MKVTVGAWGLGVSLSGVVVHLYLGDVYIRLPRVGELAWNYTGFYINRICSGSPVSPEFRG